MRNVATQYELSKLKRQQGSASTSGRSHLQQGEEEELQLMYQPRASHQQQGQYGLPRQPQQQQQPMECHLGSKMLLHQGQLPGAPLTWAPPGSTGIPYPKVSRQQTRGGFGTDLPRPSHHVQNEESGAAALRASMGPQPEGWQGSDAAVAECASPPPHEEDQGIILGSSDEEVRAGLPIDVNALGIARCAADERASIF